ncbi:AMSH-like ubiquitin thioesterase 2 isoform X4 [Carex rostrata]
MKSFLKMKPSLHPVKHQFSSSIVSWIEDEDSMVDISHFTDSEVSEDGYSHSNSYLSRNLHDMHISVRLIEEFMELAKENTSSNLETCGILGASLCQASNEEEIHATLAELSLIPVGWIHVMLPEAVAIVIAPTDQTRHYGIFRLTDPGGMAVLRECKERGFHQHSETLDGSSIYESCGHVYFKPNLRFEIVDLRSS